MFTTQGLLERLAPCREAPAWWLGLSGGLDSMVLLESLAQLRSAHRLPPLQAVHVHHGLSPAADAWAKHCQRECAARNIPLQILRVSVASTASVENAARQARYAAFETLLLPDDCLLLAHHRDDQLETLLFRMIRGTGLLGLAGMPEHRRLGHGALFRPLLDSPRSDLRHWAEVQGLCWIEDPANRDQKFARTGLRHEVLPALRRIWPGTDPSLLRLAAHAREAGVLLDELAAEDLLRLQDIPDDPWLQAWPSLAAGPLVALSQARQRNLLRYWLRQLGHGLPDARQLKTLLDQLLAVEDRQPSMGWPGVQLTRSAGRLWALPEAGVPAGRPEPLQSRAGEQPLVAGNGILKVTPVVGGLALDQGRWELGYRSATERIQLGNRPRQSLKQLFQAAGIPAWLRPAVPLLYREGLLVSVAGRWNDPAACAAPGEPGWQVFWDPHRAGV